jgi:hypothetical protein
MRALFLLREAGEVPQAPPETAPPKAHLPAQQRPGQPAQQPAQAQARASFPQGEVGVKQVVVEAGSW